MKSSGEILKDKRVQLGFSTDQIAIKLKIQEKYIIALEEGDNSIFDSRVIARGFLKKYCRILGLNEEKIEAFWRRDFNLKTDNKPIEKSFLERIYVTPRVVLVSIFGLFVFTIILFTAYQYFLLKTPPKLIVSQPNEAKIIENDYVIIIGSIDSKNELYLNNKKINVGDDGKFTEKVYIQKGFNKLSFKAISPFGVETSKILSVYANYPESEKKDETKSNTLFVKSKGTEPTFVEVKDGGKELFSGYLMPNIQKEFKGNSMFFYTDASENIEIKYNDKPVEIKEAGIFTKEFSLEQEKQQE